MEGRYFPLPLQVALCPVLRSLWMHRVRGRLLHNFSSVGYPMFCGLSFLWGGTGTRVTCCGEPGLFQSTAKSRTFPISPLPCWGGCHTQQSKLGVTNIYQRTQPKRRTVFLGHDPGKWGWVALIRLLLTTTANLTPTSLDCHENWPWEKCSGWKALFLIS